MDSAANAAEKVKMTAKGIVEDAMEGASDAKDAVTEIAADLKEQLLEKATKVKDDIDQKLGDNFGVSWGESGCGKGSYGEGRSPQRRRRFCWDFIQRSAG